MSSTTNYVVFLIHNKSSNLELNWFKICKIDKISVRINQYWNEFEKKNLFIKRLEHKLILFA